MKNNYRTEDKSECPWCKSNQDIIQMKLLVKTKSRSHTSCSVCKMPVVIQKTALGYVSLYKSSFNRYKKNYLRGVNRLKFDINVED